MCQMSRFLQISINHQLSAHISAEINCGVLFLIQTPFQQSWDFQSEQLNSLLGWLLPSPLWFMAGFRDAVTSTWTWDQNGWCCEYQVCPRCGCWRGAISAYKGDTDKTSLTAKAWRNHIQPGPGSLTMSGSGRDTVSAVFGMSGEESVFLPSLQMKPALPSNSSNEGSSLCRYPVSGQPGSGSRSHTNMLASYLQCPIE